MTDKYIAANSQLTTINYTRYCHPHYHNVNFSHFINNINDNITIIIQIIPVIISTVLITMIQHYKRHDVSYNTFVFI